MPRGIPNTKSLDSREFDGTSDTLIMPTTGDARIIVPGEDGEMSAEAMLAAGKKDYADALAFMEEKVKVVVFESENENADPLPMVSVNGVNQFFIRGQEVWVKRKFVEVLARAKSDAITAKSKLMALGEEPVQQLTRRRAMKYPFDLVEDPNPRGRAWLKSVLGQDQLNAA